MNVLDFCTGQVFDWFVASDSAFALIERLPSTVTGNVTNPDCREAAEVGIDKMYTQIIREIPVNPDVWHHVDIALTRHDGAAWADYFLDHQPMAHVGNVGIPLDKQGASFTGIYPSAGAGDQVADQLDSVRLATACSRCWTRSPSSIPKLPSYPFQSRWVASQPSAPRAGRACSARALAHHLTTSQH